ncbi:XRE family transcriptional regulator [Allobaculum stercoricanis]|uniref:helix-turn-helix domain-containing protein n=1 Tax=Allobaculum stercoricanis TaxID=174709 RepID=UPI00294224FA|nr:XRE family transcriptional regulator [Allobaculum stercoricanis]
MIGEMIKKRREQLGMSQDELAKKLGYKSRSSINKMELGLQDVPQRKVKDFAKVLSVSIGYLLEDNQKQISDNLIPIYSALSCGTGAWIDEIPEEYVSIPESMRFHGRAFANYAEGNSMEPKIKSGDLLIFQECPQVVSGSIGSFSLNDSYYCKRFKQLPDGSFWLFSDNPEYDPIPITENDDFRVLGLYKLKISKEQ